MNPTSSAADIARGRIVPWLIAAFFAAFILPLLAFVWIAFAHRADLVTEHAYDKGLTYNRTLVSEQDMKALGWHAQIAMRGGVLVVQLCGSDGTPLTNARCRAWFVRPASAGMDQSVDMHETAPGRYEAAMPHPAPGLWQVRVTAERHGRQFQAARDITVNE